MSDPGRYTVGFLCALSKEVVAVSQFLDEEHEQPTDVSRNDKNSYISGKIGNHWVVIAHPPQGEYGVYPVAAVAADMAESFPNIEVYLSVGIGGGAPSTNHDVRLGDIVVGSPSSTHSGVYMYDYKGVRRLSPKVPPPVVILEALAKFQADNEQRGSRIQEEIKAVLEKTPRLKQRFQRPDQTSDKLYQPEFIHQDTGPSCADGCGDRDLSLVHRPKRHTREPIVHYGLIASSHQIMNDAKLRDTLANDQGVLCFEIEAAGLLDRLPCLVIRGIADYSDSHKYPEWQGYAAIAAAAYTKQLLCHISSAGIEATAGAAEALPALNPAPETDVDLNSEMDSDAESSASETGSTASSATSMSTGDPPDESMLERAVKDFAHALCSDPELEKLYREAVAKFGVGKFDAIHDRLLKKYLRDLRPKAHDNIEVQAIRALRHRTQRAKLTKLIHEDHYPTSPSFDNKEAPMNLQEDTSRGVLQNDPNQSDVEASPDEEDSEDENDHEEIKFFADDSSRDQDETRFSYNRAIEFLTNNPFLDQYKTRLYCLVHGPRNIPQALDYGKRKALRRLLEDNFNAVALGDYEWLQELSEVGYSAEDMARLLLEEARDAPWIYFDPQEVKEPTLGSRFSQDNLQDPSEPSLKRTLEKRCGLGGIVPRKSQKLEGHVSFRDDYCTACISYADVQKRKAANRSTLLSRVKRVLFDFLAAIKHLDSADLGSDHFTVVLKPPPASADHEGTETVELIRIKLDEVFALHNELESSLFSDTVGKSELRKSYELVKDILRPLFQDEPQLPADADADLILHLCCLSVQFLCSGLLSFHQAHIGPLMPFFINRPQEHLILRGSHTSERNGDWHITAELMPLTCLGKMIGKSVLTFQMSREWPEDDEYPDSKVIKHEHDLATTVDDLISTWGPGVMLDDECEEGHLRAISIRGGSVYLEQGADEHLHWSPGSPKVITSLQPFNRHAKYTIGAQITEQIDCTNDEGDCRNRSFVRLLGTCRSDWAPKQRQMGAQVGQGNILIQVGQIWEKSPGRTVKQHQLGPARTVDLLDCLEKEWGVELSYCTGIARRVRIRKLVADLLPVFTNSEDWGPRTWRVITTTLAGNGPLHALRSSSQVTKDELNTLRDVISSVLHALEPTGFSANLKRFIAAWPRRDDLCSGIHIRCDEDRNIWLQLLTDSEHSAVFCYISRQCLVYDHTRERIRCPENWSTTIPTVLKTTVIPFGDDQSTLSDDWRPMPGNSYHLWNMRSYIVLRVENGSDDDQGFRLIASKSRMPPFLQHRHYWAGHWKSNHLLQERQHGKRFGVEVIISCLAE